MTQTTLTNNQRMIPISVYIDTAGNIKQAGKPFELKVTIFNQDDRKNLLITVKIKSIKLQDGTERPLCKELPAPQTIGLNANNSGDVKFALDIDRQIPPGPYQYKLSIEAEGVEKEEIGNLIVKSFVKSSQQEIDPTFEIIPYSSSSEPILVQPGEKVNLSIRVDNRSQRVDKFRLTCPDLNLLWRDFPKDNLQIKYINNNSNSRIFPIRDGLELNPGEQGEISLELTVPLNSLAGIYSPTIRIYSDNNLEQNQEKNQPNNQGNKNDNETLILLDLFHLKVQENHNINIQMITKVGKVQNLPGLFQLQIYNQGNTSRELDITIESADQDQDCTYNPQQTTVKILPQQTEPAIVNIEVQPPKSWLKRPFYGRLFNFTVNVKDKQDRELINPRFSGVLIWEARPWWHFLILALIILAILTGTGLLIWWLFFKPKPSAEILQFYPENVLYKEINNEAIRLNWQISEINKVKNIEIVGLSPDGNITSAPITYNLEKGIPNQLQTACNVEKQILTCQDIITDARKPGKYNFEIKIGYQKGKIIVFKSQKTSQITIEPIPQPEIISLKPSQTEYQEQENNPNNSIHLNWEINHPEQVEQLSLIGKSANGEIKVPINAEILKIKQYCSNKTVEKVICSNIPTNAINPGEYIFELSIISKNAIGNNQPKIITQKTEPIKIKPIPTEIVSFKIDGQDVLPNRIFELNPNQKKQLNISWQIKGTKNIKVELVPTPGKVPVNGEIYYTLSPTNNKQTITLQVTNPTGEITSKSTVVETIVKPEPTVSPTPTSSPKPTPTNTPQPPKLTPDKTNPNTLVKPPEQKNNNNNNNSNNNKLPTKPPVETPEPPEKPENNILPPADLPPQSQ